jgi:hypothetical protein
MATMNSQVESGSVSPRILTLLAAFQALDAVICIKPIPYVAQCLDDVRYPQRGRWIFPIVKAAAAVGLFVGIRSPWLARLTLIMLTIYFSLAVGAHIRVRDFGPNAAAATSLLVTYGTLAVRSSAGFSAT